MCGLIGFYAVNLTRSDGRMKVRLKVLPNKPRDSAWPPSVRAVKCPVKSGNEQDLYSLLLPPCKRSEHNVETACETKRKV